MSLAAFAGSHVALAEWHGKAGDREGRQPWLVGFYQWTSAGVITAPVAAPLPPPETMGGILSEGIAPWTPLGASEEELEEFLAKNDALPLRRVGVLPE